MTTDLRALLRDAETVEQQCDAVLAFLDRAEKFIDGVILADVMDLGRLVGKVRAKDYPPAILLGVVAAVVDRDVDITSYSVETFANGTAETSLWSDELSPRAKAEARRPACALALAILDAMEGGR